MGRVAVRTVEASEYEPVARLIVDVYAEELGGFLSDGYRAELADVARRAEHSVVLVAVDAGAANAAGVLGSITYVPGPESPYAEFAGADEAGIRMLVVAPKAQRRGVGAQLVRACVDLAHQAGKARISLHTTPTMIGAQRLYESLGFERALDSDWAPEPGVDLLGYVLELAPGR
jgi:ribosomal protein S18 acetylase RimI-like enzyme